MYTTILGMKVIIAIQLVLLLILVKKYKQMRQAYLETKANLTAANDLISLMQLNELRRMNEENVSLFV